MVIDIMKKKRRSDKEKFRPMCTFGERALQVSVRNLCLGLTKVRSSFEALGKYSKRVLKVSLKYFNS
jgi:hypothetical protein